MHGQRRQPRRHAGAPASSCAQRAPHAFEIVDQPRNQGKAEAVRAGMLRAFELGCELCGYWDADLATPLDEAPRFAAVLDRAARAPDRDSARACSCSAARSRAARRAITSAACSRPSASMLLRMPIYDTQCGAKLFRVTPMTRALFAQPFTAGWTFDVEADRAPDPLAPAARCGRRGSTDLRTAARDAGTTSPARRSRAVDFVRALLEMTRIYLRYLRRGAPPLPLESARASRRRSHVSSRDERRSEFDPNPGRLRGRRVLREPGHVGDALRRRARLRCPRCAPVLGLFEGVVSGAADGYARMADKPAATLLHLGPGPDQRARQRAQRAQGAHADGQRRRRSRDLSQALRRAAHVGRRRPGAPALAFRAHDALAERSRARRRRRGGRGVCAAGTDRDADLAGRRLVERSVGTGAAARRAARRAKASEAAVRAAAARAAAAARSP